MNIFSKLPVKELDDIANLLTKRSSLSETFNYLSEITPSDFILIGGIARSQYAPARLTNDIDILVKDEDFENIKRFLRGYEGVKQIRGHAWLIKGIEVEILTPSFLGLDSVLVDYIFGTKISIPFGDKAFLCSKEGIILLKLQRSSSTDLEDIYNILKSNPDINVNALSPYLSEKQLQLLLTAKSKVLID
ncbi:MAG: nucleotidyltransferase family protein [Novosphingobium sp.]|nr:nucleotidyltransferase family protein [Novosphingobium sp.]